MSAIVSVSRFFAFPSGPLWVSFKYMYLIAVIAFALVLPSFYFILKEWHREDVKKALCEVTNMQVKYSSESEWGIGTVHEISFGADGREEGGSRREWG